MRQQCPGSELQIAEAAATIFSELSLKVPKHLDSKLNSIVVCVCVRVCCCCFVVCVRACVCVCVRLEVNIHGSAVDPRYDDNYNG